MIAVLAGLAGVVVVGVASKAGQIKSELIAKLGMKNLARGVHVTVEDDSVFVTLTLVLKYGYSVLGISTKVQERVKAAIENMTGLMVAEVNVRVAGVVFDQH